MVSVQVRIDGYKAIVQMSKEQPKWVKRNADVLAQLLQSGEFFNSEWCLTSASGRSLSTIYAPFR